MSSGIQVPGFVGGLVQAGVSSGQGRIEGTDSPG